MTIEQARRTASAGVALGAPWLAAFSLTISVVAVLSLFLSTDTTALLTMFQGAVALPLAFALERTLAGADRP